MWELQNVAAYKSSMNPLGDIFEDIDVMKLIHILSVSLCWVHAATALFGGYQARNYKKRNAPVPVPGADGICFTHAVQWGENCANLAESNSITVSDIETWNTRSWGWRGCSKVMVGDFVCLSSGAFPMPRALPDAVCGPQTPGAMRPANYADLASVKPCLEGQCVSSRFGDLVIALLMMISARIGFNAEIRQTIAARTMDVYPAVGYMQFRRFSMSKSQVRKKSSHRRQLAQRVQHLKS